MMPFWWPRCSCGRWVARQHWFYGKSYEEDMSLPWRCLRCQLCSREAGDA